MLNQKRAILPAPDISPTAHRRSTPPEAVSSSSSRGSKRLEPVPWHRLWLGQQITSQVEQVVVLPEPGSPRMSSKPVASKMVVMFRSSRRSWLRSSIPSTTCFHGPQRPPQRALAQRNQRLVVERVFKHPIHPGFIHPIQQNEELGAVLLSGGRQWRGKVLPRRYPSRRAVHSQSQHKSYPHLLVSAPHAIECCRPSLVSPGLRQLQKRIESGKNSIPLLFRVLIQVTGEPEFNH